MADEEVKREEEEVPCIRYINFENGLLEQQAEERIKLRVSNVFGDISAVALKVAIASFALGVLTLLI